jgi:ribosomal protein S18 acetylase RimI-like enzyme
MPFQDEVSLRWARLEDCAQIAITELQSAEVERRERPMTISVTEMSEVWKRRLSGNAKVILAVRASRPGAEELLGFLSFRGELRQGAVHALYVSPRHLRHGIGRFLMDTAAHVVRMQGGHRLTVHVEMLNHGAQDFYRTLHFCASGVRSAHLIIMTKEV